MYIDNLFMLTIRYCYSVKRLVNIKIFNIYISFRIKCIYSVYYMRVTM